MKVLRFQVNSKLDIKIIKDILKSNKIKVFLTDKKILLTNENNIELIHNVLLNSLDSNEIIEIIKMDMGKVLSKIQLKEKEKYKESNNFNGLNGSGDSNCGGGDNQSDPYVRRSELKYELNQLETNLRKDMANFVTKSELREELNLLRKDMVTKADLKEELKDFVRKEDLKNFATKDELNQLETNLRKDMANFVTKDEFNARFDELKQLILLINDNLINMNNRLIKVENKVH